MSAPFCCDCGLASPPAPHSPSGTRMVRGGGLVEDVVMSHEGLAAENLAAAWRDRADQEAAVSRLHGAAFIRPDEYDRSEADFRTAVAWYRYWTGIGSGHAGVLPKPRPRWKRILDRLYVGRWVA